MEDDRPQTEVPHDDADVLVHGGALHPLVSTVSAAAREFHFRVIDGMVTVKCVDSANVMRAEASITPRATDGFAENPLSEPTHLALSEGPVRHAINQVRKGRGSDPGDPVSISLDRELRNMDVRVIREYDDVTTSFNTTIRWLDPETVNTPKEVAVNGSVTGVTIPRKSFTEAVSHLTDTAKSVRVSGSDGVLTFEGVGVETGDHTVTVPDITPKFDMVGLYDSGNMDEVRRAVESVKPDTVRLKWGDDFPITVNFERPQMGFEAEIMVAPRIAAD